MRRLLFAVLLSAAFAMPAAADVTIRQTSGGKGLGVSGKTDATTYIKGNKMRSDIVMGDKTQTTIFDVDAQKLYIFDSKKKEAEVWDISSMSEEISKNVDMSNMKISFKPNGQTRQISGQTANGYELEITMPTAMGGAKEMSMTLRMSGPVWIVKNAPGAEDYRRFYKAAVEKGWILGDPRAAKAQPGQAKAMSEMYKQMSEIGGIAYEIDMQIKMEGSGPMGGLLARMGNVSFSNVVNSVDTGALSDDLFAPPPGYKLKPKK